MSELKDKIIDLINDATKKPCKKREHLFTVTYADEILEAIYEDLKKEIKKLGEPLKYNWIRLNGWASKQGLKTGEKKQ